MFVDMFVVVVSSFGCPGWAVGAVVDAVGGARQAVVGRNGGLVAPGPRCCGVRCAARTPEVTGSGSCCRFGA